MHPKWGGILAGKAIAISLAGIGAALALSRLALPKVVSVLSEMGQKPADWILLALDYRDELPLLPVPGLLLGIAALMFRPMRGPLAFLAIVAAGLATAGIVAMLIGSIAPFYDASRAF